jgi:hypothetical protein
MAAAGMTLRLTLLIQQPHAPQIQVPPIHPTRWTSRAPPSRRIRGIRRFVPFRIRIAVN